MTCDSRIRDFLRPPLPSSVESFPETLDPILRCRQAERERSDVEIQSSWQSVTAPPRPSPPISRDDLNQPTFARAQHTALDVQDAGRAPP
jgi:hypothetical protein